MPNAHLLAGLVRRRASFPLLVRSCYDPVGPRLDLRARVLYRFCTDGLVVINAEARARAVGSLGMFPETVQVAEPGIDLDRFTAQPPWPDARPSFGLAGDAFVVGVVSRVRARRRIDRVLEAVHRLAAEFPQLRLLIVGRGSPGAVDAVVGKPARQKGITDRIVLPGYCRGERLVAAYRVMDVLVYPTPGTDKTCRTVREALASGVPVIAPRIGFLPQLIDHGVTGRLMDRVGSDLAEILTELIRNPARRQNMAHQAAVAARQRFSLARQAEKILSFYERRLGAKGR
ncbi:MAG: glycosyltransferase family 4 protein, partial [Desulfobacterales bacterium]